MCAATTGSSITMPQWVRTTPAIYSLFWMLFTQCLSLIQIRRHLDLWLYGTMLVFRAVLVQTWFATHPQFVVLYLPPYSPFLNPIEEFFSAWRWKVYDCQPHARMPLLQALEDACGDIEVASVQGWMRHAKRFFPQCLARENILCDVDEVLWPDQAQRRDEA